MVAAAETLIPRHSMKKLIALIFVVASLTLGAAAAAPESAPNSVVHVVTVSWKADTKPEQIQAALDGAKALPTKYSGITHVWTKTIKAKGDRSNAIVMEFADEAAFKAYTDSPAQKEWYKTYLPIREKSTTFDITN